MSGRSEDDAFSVTIGLAGLLGCLIIVISAVVQNLFYLLGGLAIALLAMWLLLRRESS